MAQKKISALLELGAKIDPSLTSGLNKAANGLRELDKAGKLQQAVKGIQALSQAEKKLAHTRQKLNDLRKKGQGNSAAADRLRASIDKEGQAIGKMQRAAKAAGIDIKRLAEEEYNLSRAANKAAASQARLAKVKAFGARAGSAIKSGGIAATGAAGVAGLGIIGGLVAMGRQAVDLTSWADDLADLGEAIDMPTKALQVWSFAAGAAGVEQTKLVSSIAKFQALLSDEDKLAKPFTALGLSLDKVRKLEPVDQLTAVSEAFKNYKGSLSKAVLAQELFGRGGYRLKGVLDLGVKGLRATQDEAERTGYILGTSAMNDVTRADAALNKFMMTMTGFRNKAVTPLLPAMSLFSERLSESIIRNGPGLESQFQRLGEKASVFIDKIASGALDNMITNVTRLGPAIGNAADTALPKLGTVITALENIGALAGKVVTGINAVSSAGVGIRGVFNYLMNKTPVDAVRDLSSEAKRVSLEAKNLQGAGVKNFSITNNVNVQGAGNPTATGQAVARELKKASGDARAEHNMIPR